MTNKIRIGKHLGATASKSTGYSPTLKLPPGWLGRDDARGMRRRTSCADVTHHAMKPVVGSNLRVSAECIVHEVERQEGSVVEIHRGTATVDDGSVRAPARAFGMSR